MKDFTWIFQISLYHINEHKQTEYTKNDIHVSIPVRNELMQNEQYMFHTCNVYITV